MSILYAEAALRDALMKRRKVRSKSTGEHPHQSATPTNPPHKYTPSHKSTPKGLHPRILKSPN